MEVLFQIEDDLRHGSFDKKAVLGLFLVARYDLVFFFPWLAREAGLTLDVIDLCVRLAPNRAEEVQYTMLNLKSLSSDPTASIKPKACGPVRPKDACQGTLASHAPRWYIA